MDRLKQFRTYVLWIVLFYIFSMFITYIGLNATYRNIKPISDIPNNINVEVAQATKVNGRIYGKITTIEENELDGSYIKIQIYNRKGEIVGVKYLKIENVEKDVPKKFVAYFTSNNVKYYTVEIVEDSEDVKEDVIRVGDLYKDVFTDEQLKAITVLALIFGLVYLV